jgi:hypothetical protein
MVLLDCRRIIPIPARKGIIEIRIKMTISFLRSFINTSPEGSLINIGKISKEDKKVYYTIQP